jgi:DNA polymerase-3 subunit epsilon
MNNSFLDKYIDTEISKLPYAILDLETTGFKPGPAKITEVAIIFYEDGKEERFETFVNPECHIPDDITNITHITDEMVKDSPTIDELAPSLYEMLKDRIFVSHNVPFDWSFFEYFFKTCLGYDYKSPSLCTLNLSRKLLRLPSNKLENAAKHFGYNLIDAHRAMNDTEAVKALLLNFFNVLKEKNIFTYKDLYASGLLYAEKPPCRY